MKRMNFTLRILMVVLLALAVEPHFDSQIFASTRVNTSTGMSRPGDNGKPNNHRPGGPNRPQQSLDRPGSNNGAGNKHFDRNRREAEKLLRKADEYQRKADSYNYEAKKCLREADQYKLAARRYAGMRDYRNAQKADRKAQNAMNNYSKYSRRAADAARTASQYRQQAARILR